MVDEDGVPSQVGISSFVSGQGCHADMPAGKYFLLRYLLIKRTVKRSIKWDPFPFSNKK